MASPKHIRVTTLTFQGHVSDVTSSVTRPFTDVTRTMVDMNLNDLYAKVKVTHFGTNRSLTYDFW